MKNLKIFLIFFIFLFNSFTFLFAENKPIQDKETGWYTRGDGIFFPIKNIVMPISDTKKDKVFVGLLIRDNVFIPAKGESEPFLILLLVDPKKENGETKKGNSFITFGVDNFLFGEENISNYSRKLDDFPEMESEGLIGQENLAYFLLGVIDGVGSHYVTYSHHLD